MAIISVICILHFGNLADREVQKEIIRELQNMGFTGWLLLVFAQFAQIVIAFIPGGPLELMAGILYGTWGGFFTCLIGGVIASALVFALVRKFGYPLVNKMFANEDLEKVKFLNNAHRLEIIVFIAFLLPFTPKDLLTYVVPLSKIKCSSFLCLTMLARTPGIIVVSAMGSNMSKGNWALTIALFFLIAVVGIAGILLKDKILAHFHHHEDQ
ncbi:MAG: VTT domain-containing protein [Clostridia bacterium]|nr:VTT domain-containing protein [Clostridia bacterium]